VDAGQQITTNYLQQLAEKARQFVLSVNDNQDQHGDQNV
jgi:hypothetical protein